MDGASQRARTTTMSAVTGAGAARGQRLRRLLLAAIGLLYIASVPWYRETGAPVSFWLGLPDWVATALVCYVLIACLNAVAWLVTPISDTEGDAATDAGRGSQP